jgi:hypothetical protein
LKIVGLVSTNEHSYLLMYEGIAQKHAKNQICPISAKSAISIMDHY